MKNEKVIIFDFGSQYTQLIARRVRELNIYSEIHPFSKDVVIDDSVKAIILSGSPYSVREVNAPKPSLDCYNILNGGVNAVNSGSARHMQKT